MSPRFDAIGIAVGDMTATLAFYRLLGLRFPEVADGEGHVEAEGTDGVRIMFDDEEIMRSFDPGWQPPRGRGRIGLAFACADAADVDRTHAAIVAAGHTSHLAPFDAFWGQRYASVVDPDGNVVDLFAPLG